MEGTMFGKRAPTLTSVATEREPTAEESAARQRQQEFRNVSPRTHFAQALENAGLGSDLSRVINGSLIIRMPYGDADRCFVAKVLSVELVAGYNQLLIRVSPLGFLVLDSSSSYSVLEFKNGKWWFQYEALDKNDTRPIHVLELL